MDDNTWEAVSFKEFGPYLVEYDPEDNSLTVTCRSYIPDIDIIGFGGRVIRAEGQTVIVRLGDAR